MDKEAGRIAPLTQTTIKALKAEDARYIVWDEDLKGFGLRVEPSGAKTFLVRYRAGGGRNGARRQFTLGRYGTLTPAQAREAANTALANVALGHDPQAERAEQRKIGTVADLCDLYLLEGVATKAASTVKLDRIRIEVIKRLIGRRTSTHLTPADVEKMRDAITEGRLRKPLIDDAKADDAPQADPKTVKRPGDRARGGTTAATKAVKLLRSIYRWAIEGKRLPLSVNPTAGVKTIKDNARERFLSAVELARLGEVLTAAEEEPDPKSRRRTHVKIVRLLLLVGARKNEIARLKWSEVQGDYLQLETSKTGRKVVPLGAPARAVLDGLTTRDGVWVFPDPNNPDEPIRNLDWAWDGIRKAAGLSDVRIHDLRHSFASVGADGGTAIFLIGKLLGHRNVSTTQRYAHLSDDPVKAAADKISKTIEAAMTGKSGDVRRAGGAR